jgi:hypothetical protein
MRQRLLLELRQQWLDQQLQGLLERLADETSAPPASADAQP